MSIVYGKNKTILFFNNEVQIFRIVLLKINK